MKIFKITKKHLKQYPELAIYDLGMYGVKLTNDRDVMVYETKGWAQKALTHFRYILKIQEES